MKVRRYFKAYLLKELQPFPGWTVNRAALPHPDPDSILYLQQNYVVTAGVFMDEKIVFERVTDEWKEFCHGTLRFTIPVYEPIDIPRAEGAMPPS
jgi:hypothetical protein